MVTGMVTQNLKELGKSRKTKLTDRICRHTKPETKKLKVWCDSVMGFHLVLYPTGRKAFGLRYTVPGTNKRVEPVLGQYPEISLVDAREMAFQWRLLIRQGIDPRQPGNESDAPSKTPQSARRSKRCLTLEELWPLYLDKHLSRHCAPLTAKVMTSKYTTWLKPHLGAKEIIDIREADVLGMLDAIEEQGSAPGYVVEFKRLLGRVIKWGKKKRLIDVPGNVGRSTDYQGGTLKSDRFLSDAELRCLWDARDLPHDVHGCWQLSLLVGTRQTETIKARWENINLTTGKESWFIPASHTKTNVPFEIPLSRAASKLLKRIWVSAGAPVAGPVFPVIYGQRMVYEKKNAHYTNCTQRVQYYLTKSGFEYEGTPPSWHDLRRNIMRGMKRCKVNKVVRKAVLNHRASSMHDTHYEGGFDPAEYWDEHRAALNVWADFLADIVGPSDVFESGYQGLSLVS